MAYILGFFLLFHKIRKKKNLSKPLHQICNLSSNKAINQDYQVSELLVRWVSQEDKPYPFSGIVIFKKS